MKMFFDQNLTFRITEVIKHFYEWDYPELVCVHLIEKYPVGYQKGVDDLVWISDLSAEGGWIVFTVDRGKSSNIQPLPEICSNLKITHVLLGNELCKPSKLKQAIVECWEQSGGFLSRKPDLVRVCERKPPNGATPNFLYTS